MNAILFIAYIVLFLSFINLIRLLFYAVASDLFDIKNIKIAKNGSPDRNRYFSKSYNPLFTVMVPAHNEEKTLERNLISIANNTYKNLELIIINDSSTDQTKKIALRFQRKYRHRFKNIKVINAFVRGKAKALNEGLKYAKGSIFMCLDADSAIAPNLISGAVESFRDKSLGAMPSNVKIFPNKGLLNLLQRVEYLICYQMKKAESSVRIQYIIGGIGSMYRMRILKKLKCFETDTITEDIDLSMKMIAQYGDKKYIGYNPALVACTEAVLSLRDLIKQRFRWKYGRYQVFLKRREMFISKKRDANRLLSWVALPYALFAELTFLFEPLTIGLMIYLLFVYGDFSMIIGSALTFSFYTIIQVTGATQSYSRGERVKLALFAPLSYLLMYLLSMVEYVATVKGFLSLKKLLYEHKTGVSGCQWDHVKRAAVN